MVMLAPRIDLESSLVTGSPEDLLFCESNEVQKLSESILSAFQNVGFYIAFNHGVDVHTLQTVQKEVSHFCVLLSYKFVT